MTTAQDNWVERLKGDAIQRDAALEELRELILRGLSRSLNGKYGCRSFHAEDVVQDALIKIMKSLDTFEGRSKFTTWAMTIATRVGISELRRKHCKDVSLEAMAGEDSLRIELAVAEDAPTGSAIDQQKILETLQELIDTKLTDKQRVAIRALLEGLPVEVIAEKSNSNRNAVYKLVHDARTRLREGFVQSGIAADDINAIFA